MYKLMVMLGLLLVLLSSAAEEEYDRAKLERRPRVADKTSLVMDSGPETETSVSGLGEVVQRATHRKPINTACTGIKLLMETRPEATADYHIRRGDTLEGIANRLDVGPGLLACINDVADPSRIIAGQRLLVPNGEIGVQVERDAHTLVVNFRETPVASYTVGTGLDGELATPLGEFEFVNVQWDPYDYENAAPPGNPDNRFGKVWMGFGKADYGIHGTNDPASVGRPSSRGCIRMYDEDAVELASVVTVGMSIEIR